MPTVDLSPAVETSTPLPDVPTVEPEPVVSVVVAAATPGLADAVELPHSWPKDEPTEAHDQAIVDGSKLVKVISQGPTLTSLERIGAEFGPVLGGRPVWTREVHARGRLLTRDTEHGMFFANDHPEAGSDRYEWFVATKQDGVWTKVRPSEGHPDADEVKLGYLKESARAQ